ncbi:MAG: ParB/RepB/Spo0J family partition protein [Actinobacteria bacterium]|nr:ParB/RepB/Spo0J family partition protein [Actinomycetota bacterium]MSY36157.1 ParB/RepB/Spo0J family partition protein [Actinomycetota bacterium]MTA72262.1 ParB/RepB/Spo0J family partition protein [Actinomycetota bacterium]MTB29879.1 ParB/RepB/Spo0J family partition protein [Actinomycetota bacterium]MUH48838.1 ParB/RepB/Spo0J family partition protein [Actinomycetota bacterium]
MMARRGGLGTHLDALIPTSLTVDGEEVATQNEVPLSEISPNPRQPRTHFDQEALNELIASIKEIGILQPPVVRQVGANKYELIMGERRFRAAKAAGLKTIPVIIRQTSDNELLREALIENIHRSQLNALEEAAAYSQLLTDFNCTHDELAVKLGRSRPLISNTIRLMNLPVSVQQKVASGLLSAGHARALLGLTDAHAIEALANQIVKEGLSVRATEQAIAVSPTKKKIKKPTTVSSSRIEFNEIAERIGDALDTRVTIQGSVKKGTIVVEFAGAEDLKRLTQKLES